MAAIDDTFTYAQTNRLIESGGKFLRTASQNPTIMSVLMGLGYSLEAHNEGWELYLPLLGYTGARAVRPGPMVGTTEQHRALLEVDVYDEPAFARAKAALERVFPLQMAFMFNRLEAQTGVLALGSVGGFLDRYVILRDGTDASREAMREQDAQAAALLESRNIINPEKEKHLRGLIKTAQMLAPEPVVPAGDAEREEAKNATAAAFKGWLNDWRQTAAAGITRRDYLILLGLAKRRSKKKDPSPTAPPA